MLIDIHTHIHLFLQDRFGLSIDAIIDEINANMCTCMIGLLFVWLTSAAAASPELDSIIMKTIAQYQSAVNAAYSVGVMHQGTVIHSQGYGLRDKELGLPVTPETRFYIGSNTKSFTVLGLAMLHDEGIFEFDTIVTAYLPDFKTIDSSINANLTPADMLSHRTGLPRHDALWGYTNLDRNEIVRRIQYLEMDYRPEIGFRNSFQYNNLMYMAAGTIIEKLKGVSWEQFTRDRILVPLGMENSGFGRAGFVDNANSAKPYNRDGLLLDFPYSKGEAVGPAGIIYSTSDDMLKYLNLYLSLGTTPPGQTLVSQAGLEEIFLPRNDSKDRHLIRNAALTFYGMAWWVDWDSTNWVGYHGGAIGGYTSQMAFDNANQIAVVVLANHGGDSAVNPIVTEILGYLHGTQARDASLSAPAPADFESGAFPGPTASLFPLAKSFTAAAQYQTVKRFQHAGYGEMDIVTDGTQSYYNWFDNYWPIYKKEGIYDYYWRINPSIGNVSVPSYLETDSIGDTVALYPLLEQYAVSRFAAISSADVPQERVAANRFDKRDARIVIASEASGIYVFLRLPHIPWQLDITNAGGSVIQTFRGMQTHGTAAQSIPRFRVMKGLACGLYLYRFADDTGYRITGSFIAAH